MVLKLKIHLKRLIILKRHLKDTLNWFHLWFHYWNHVHNSANIYQNLVKFLLNVDLIVLYKTTKFQNFSFNINRVMNFFLFLEIS